jgi:hypothetical protein
VSLLVVGGELSQRGADDGDVVSGGVRAGVAAAQQYPDRLPGPGLAVVEECGQWVMPEAAFERRRRELLLRVRGDQGGVDVEDQRATMVDSVIRRVGPGPSPYLSAGRGPGRVDCRRGPVGVASQGSDHPGHRRVRGDRTEHGGCFAQRRDVGQAVAADRERHC